MSKIRNIARRGGFPAAVAMAFVAGLCLSGPDAAGAGAIMIGDSTTDVLTARAAGVPAVLVSYGYSPDPVETLGAAAVTGDFADVPGLAARILDRAGGRAVERQPRPVTGA